jgi:uncharacterized protein
MIIALMRQHPALSLLAVVLLIAGVGCAVVMIGSVRRAMAELHPARIQPQRPVAEALLVDMQDITISTDDGVLLSGWYVPSRNRAAIILGHGFSTNREAMLPEARLLVGAGFGVLICDWRAHGASAGTQCTWGDRERKDVSAMIDYLTARPEIDPHRIGGLGVSLGGVVLVLAAADDRRLAAVAGEAVWTSFEDEAWLDPPRWGPLSALPQLVAFRRAGLDIGAIRPVNAVTQFGSRPLLLMYGGNDAWLPSEMRAQMVAAAPSAESWLIPEAVHAGCRAARPGEYDTRIVNFFIRALLPPFADISRDNGLSPQEAACHRG